MAAHARLSPSAAHCWAHCTASISAVETAREAGLIPRDGGSSPAADQGTAAHQVREECLALGLDPENFLGTSVLVNGKAWPVDAEMVEALQPGIDWIRERAGEGMLVEHRVSLDPWLPGQFGTIDCAFLMPSWDYFEVEGRRTLVLSDLKYGMGLVEARGNLQQQIYAIGALVHFFGPDPAAWDVERVTIVIDQPRRGGMRDWDLDREALVEFAGWIRERGAEALSGQGVYRPSASTCEWCPLNKPGLCAPHDEWISEMLFGDTDGPKPAPNPRQMTPSRRFEILRNAPAITRWLSDLAAESLAAALAGEPDPGSKAVFGAEGDRQWVDETAVETVLVEALGVDGAFSRKILSPAQAEKVMRPGRKVEGHPVAWSKLMKMYTRSSARPILVPADDPRPAVLTAEDLFDEYSNETKE